MFVFDDLFLYQLLGEFTNDLPVIFGVEMCYAVFPLIKISSLVEFLTDQEKISSIILCGSLSGEALIPFFLVLMI